MLNVIIEAHEQSVIQLIALKDEEVEKNLGKDQNYYKDFANTILNYTLHKIY